MASFHASQFGGFDRSLLVDLHGYTHTTAAEWLAAPVDWGHSLPPGRYRRDEAKRLAVESRKRIAKAERAIARWRNENR